MKKSIFITTLLFLLFTLLFFYKKCEKTAVQTYGNKVKYLQVVDHWEGVEVDTLTFDVDKKIYGGKHIYTYTNKTHTMCYKI